MLRTLASQRSSLLGACCRLPAIPRSSLYRESWLPHSMPSKPASIGLDAARARRFNSTTQASISELCSAGLCNLYTPSGLGATVIDVLHSNLGLSWFFTIVAAGVAARSIIAPCQIRAQNIIAREKVNMDKLKERNNIITEETKSPSTSPLMRKKFQDDMAAEKPEFKGLKTAILLQMLPLPIHLSMYMGFSALFNNSDLIPSIREGGLAWFTDLSVCDPYYILPLATTLLMVTSVEISNIMNTLSGNQMQKNATKLMRFLPLVFLPFACTFSSGMNVYFLASNVTSIGQNIILMLPKVRAYFGMKPLNTSTTLKFNDMLTPPSLMDTFHANLDGKERIPKNIPGTAIAEENGRENSPRQLLEKRKNSLMKKNI